MNNKEINYSKISLELIKHLFSQEYPITIGAFYELSANRNTTYTQYLHDDTYQMSLIDGSSINVTIDKSKK